MQRCIEIAKNGFGKTYPNPSVGCVIVNNGKIIGEGYTSAYGGNHAEVNAIRSVTDKNQLKTATLYVTLEPCSHYGKTPPCSDLIIKHKIPKVVIGCVDDHEKVAGKGIKKLEDSGVEVLVGVLDKACKKHHKRFFTFHNKKRPYIILKWAETADGLIAPKSKTENKPIWITNIYSRQLVHKWRTEEHAILVGTNTVIQDNPSLTARDWVGKNPIRVVIDKKPKLAKSYNIFDNQAPTVHITELKNPIDANKICDIMFDNQITSVIIEGGSKTLQSFIDANLWDEARVFVGQTKFGSGVQGPSLKGNLIDQNYILKDTLNLYIND
ncbi:bifunctional diaminohydroxyphosphoribosylaminopyrimidine deaminase/5-amino-6-(5-phosphoribosylamino)uracil reductase RibD [Cognatitamlana onchidii]|uniref:bifunctional diaminohydroxyphosphoribosylaminopyrimidine deaminase/5-amino-6-(5-phosphoribosylamino)uracil reductase RibD n=1 Tax=Cognatitamlana onchidii TaxID=2562860 RepID=UPI0010A68F22